jgi:GNAT superfamily N-acetyltransferase
VLVAEHDGTLVGTTDLITLPNLTHNATPYANIENVIVRRESRGLGIGRALVQHAVDRARAAGCYKVQLTSNVARGVAHDLYESVGFEPSATGFRLYF